MPIYSTKSGSSLFWSGVEGHKDATLKKKKKKHQETEKKVSYSKSVWHRLKTPRGLEDIHLGTESHVLSIKKGVPMKAEAGKGDRLQKSLNVMLKSLDFMMGKWGGI